MPTAVETLARAKAFHAAGDLHSALRLYRQAVQADPTDGEAHYLLAIACHALGHAAEAIASLAEAIRLDPQRAEAHNHLGALLAEQGKLDEAIACFEHAHRLMPGSEEICDNLRHARAIKSDRLGQRLASQGKLTDAAACYRHVLELAPDFAEAHCSLGAVLARQEKLDEAVVSFRRALELKPDLPEAHNNLGIALQRQGNFAGAEDCYHRALGLKPDYPEAHNNLGTALEDQGRFDEAVERYRWALELKPEMAEASSVLAARLIRQEKFAEAKECYLKSLPFHPWPDVWRLNIVSLCPSVFDTPQEIEDYRRRLLLDIEQSADPPLRREPAVLAKWACTPPFNLQFHGHNDRPIREAYARLYRDCFASETPTGSRGRRPRIGFVVTDQHEKAFLKSMGGVLERIKADLFELVVIGPHRGLDRLRPAIRNPAVSMLPAPNEFDPFVAAVRAAQCDVLYYWEVGTDNTNYFLPFFRLAPVQCTSWGIQVTSGIPQLDYYLSSELVEPADAGDHYTERLLLARTLLTFQRRSALPKSPKDRGFFGIAPRKHLYLCAQQLGKFHPDFDPILAAILRADEQGVLAIPSDRQGGFIARQLQARFAASMPDVVERIVFLPFQAAPDDYLSLIAAADVLLDPLHFGGVNSTYDGFSLNKPIVTLPSRFHRGRYTLGCYKKMGLSDCIAADADQYVAIAVALGTDSEFRAEIGQQIREASPVLFEDSQAVSEHERLFGVLVDQARSSRQRDAS